MARPPRWRRRTSARQRHERDIPLVAGLDLPAQLRLVPDPQHAGVEVEVVGQRAGGRVRRAASPVSMSVRNSGNCQSSHASRNARSWSGVNRTIGRASSMGMRSISQGRERVLGVGREVPTLRGVVEQGAAALQDVLDAPCPAAGACRVGVAVGRHADRPQVADELLGVAGMELRGSRTGVPLEEASRWSVAVR